MKKIIFLLCLCISFIATSQNLFDDNSFNMNEIDVSSTFSQTNSFNLFDQSNDNNYLPLTKGQWLIEANTGSLATGNTAFSLISANGNTQWSIGAETGYFIKDNLALKVGLGYTDLGAPGADGFVYKIGAKYYINGNLPLGLDFTGATSDGESVNWVGVQIGYAWFIVPNISIEPALRYNISLDGFKADSTFQGLIGFVLHL